MSTALSARDVNAPLTSQSQDLDSKPLESKPNSQPQSMEYHRQVLQSRMQNEATPKSYVSPSDALMSPCTAKLSALKSKHYAKAKPQSLFARASTKNAESTTSAPREGGTSLE